MQTSVLTPWPVQDINGTIKAPLLLIARSLVLVLFMVLSFIPVQKTVTDLYWGYDADNYRDMSNVNNLLAGNLVQDPAYLDEYRWYNPLLHWMEAGIVKFSGIPVNEVITRGGPYLNLAGPVCFFVMMLVLFGFSTAICAAAGFLFLTSIDIPGYFSATYTPWLYPVTFAQFIFYAGIIAMYFAFRKPSVSRFALLGLITGFAFLAHTAPALILVLQVAVLSSILLFRIIKGRSDLRIVYLLKCIAAAAVCFLVSSLPFTWIVVGKYHLNMTNVDTWEYAEPMFQIRNLFYLLKVNLSVSFFIAVFGVYALFKSKIPFYIKHILYSWLIISLLLYIYVTLSKFIRFHYGITFPGIVPSFHFFFYLKSVQSVFFGFGFVTLMNPVLDFVYAKFSDQRFKFLHHGYTIIFLIAVIVVINYPAYLNRGDFRSGPLQTADQYRADQIQVYQWLVSKTGINEVVLCEDDQVDFPLLPSGRKMVACSVDHTNPYVEFSPRKKDRDSMLEILKGDEAADHALFSKYNIRYVLTKNAMHYREMEKIFPHRVFMNESFSIHEIKNKTFLAGR